ncbi:MAG: hypothetical protein EOO99_05895 [Pedobacter sp.]|nr:MAG: hypothetical protein EOO99_05895 [Pedobacter sp.]
MKLLKYSFGLVLVTLLFSCGIGKQTQQLKAFENCTFKFVQMDSLIVAGSDLTSAIKGESINLSQVSGIAMGFLTREVPLQGKFSIEVKNEGSKLAALNQFDYELEVEGKPFTQGTFNQPIQVNPGQTLLVQVPIQADIYQFLKQNGMLSHLQSFLSGIKNGPEKTLKVQLKIKPSIKVGSELIKYPGFINLEKTISNLDIR